MFTTITAKPHAKWSHELRMLAGGSFTATFGPGLNVIVGPNGSGKSVLLRALEAYALFEKRFFKPPRASDAKERAAGWIDERRSTSAGVKIEGGWTGTTTWRIEPHAVHQIRDMDELLDLVEQDEKAFALRLGGQHLSGGEKTWTGLQQAVSSFKNTPLHPVPLNVEGLPSWQRINGADVNRILAEAKHAGTEPDQRTLLIDEPEQSFDFKRRMEFAEQLDDRANTKRLSYQMIIATHCPALMAVASRVIETVPGTVAAADDYLKWINARRVAT